MLASSVLAVVVCNVTEPRVCTLVLYIVVLCVFLFVCVHVCVCPPELICGYLTKGSIVA